MKTYDIPIVYQSIKQITVKANSLEGAVCLALKQFLSEPDDLYIADSFEIDNIVEDWYPNENFDLNIILNNL